MGLAYSAGQLLIYLLVDFINRARAPGLMLEQAVIESGAVRAMPIILTALAAMHGAFFILSDPIFQGLAVSVVFACWFPPC